jgi:indolepyruvate ferredoxin oxidoreductase alpha subunit
MKSSMWLLDPRPDLPTIVRMVEKGFELSEASHAPVMLELRVRACHVTGEFTAKTNRASAKSGLNRIDGPPRFNYARLAHHRDVCAGNRDGPAPAPRAGVHARAQAQ